MTDHEGEQAFRDFEAYLDGARLPRGVHRLSQESIDALERGHLRGQEIERRHLKPVSE